MAAAPAPRISSGDPFDKPYREDGAVCWRLWRSAVVNWDGGLAPCCYLTDKSEDFGDVSETPSRRLERPKYTAARGLFKEGGEPEEWVGCLDCSVYLGSPAALLQRSGGDVRK